MARSRQDSSSGLLLQIKDINSCVSWEVRVLKQAVGLDGDTDEGIFLIECTQVMESFTSQEEEAEFSEEGNRKLLWVLVETVTGWKLRPTPQDCSWGI